MQSGLVNAGRVWQGHLTNAAQNENISALLDKGRSSASEQPIGHGFSRAECPTSPQFLRPARPQDGQPQKFHTHPQKKRIRGSGRRGGVFPPHQQRKPPPAGLAGFFVPIFYGISNRCQSQGGQPCYLICLSLTSNIQSTRGIFLKPPCSKIFFLVIFFAFPTPSHTALFKPRQRGKKHWGLALKKKYLVRAALF